MRYGETWRSHRRAFRECITEQAFNVVHIMIDKCFRMKDAIDIENIQLKATHHLLSNLVHGPENWTEHVRL